MFFSLKKRLLERFSSVSECKGQPVCQLDIRTNTTVNVLKFDHFIPYLFGLNFDSTYVIISYKNLVKWQTVMTPD